MGNKKVVLGDDRLVRVILGLRILDIVAVLVLWERKGSSATLERELELLLGLINLIHLGRLVSHFCRDLTAEHWWR